MHAQKDFYTKITDSRHTYEQMKITQLNHVPEVARATFSTYWEAKPRNKPNHLIKSVLSEDWIVQRVNEKELKFVLYIISARTFLPDSATFSDLGY
jgi:hypothetical protein